MRKTSGREESERVREGVSERERGSSGERVWIDDHDGMLLRVVFFFLQTCFLYNSRSVSTDLLVDLLVQPLTEHCEERSGERLEPFFTDPFPRRVLKCVPNYATATDTHSFFLSLFLSFFLSFYPCFFLSFCHTLSQYSQSYSPTNPGVSPSSGTG